MTANSPSRAAGLERSPGDRTRQFPPHWPVVAVLHLDDRWIWDVCSSTTAPSTTSSTWEVLPDALGPGPTGSWDDGAPWTGSIVRHDDRWHMACTGTGHAEHGRVQRIGLAVSDDLVRWERRDEAPSPSRDDDLRRQAPRRGRGARPPRGPPP